MATQAENSIALPTPAADSTYRPLVLTPAEDLKGYVLSRLGHGVLFAITCTSVLSVLLIFVFVAREALPFLRDYSVARFLTQSDWYPEAGHARFGVLAVIVGSAYVTVAALVFAVPTGILAAVFLSDIVGFRARSWIKPVIEVLAAVPSVAYGFFAVRVLAPGCRRTGAWPQGPTPSTARSSWP